MANLFKVDSKDARRQRQMSFWCLCNHFLKKYSNQFLIFKNLLAGKKKAVKIVQYRYFPSHLLLLFVHILWRWIRTTL